MTVKELIKKLNTFDQDHYVSVEMDGPNHDKYHVNIDHVVFKNGDCVIITD